MKTKRVCLCSCFPQTTQCTLNVVICLFIFLIKGLLCSFGKDISIRRERSSLTNFLNTETNYVNKPSLFSWQDKLNKQTDLKGQPDFMLFYFFFFFFFICGGLCHLFSFKRCSGTVFSSENSLFIHLWKNWNYSPKLHSAPLFIYYFTKSKHMVSFYKMWSHHQQYVHIFKLASPQPATTDVLLTHNSLWWNMRYNSITLIKAFFSRAEYF